MPVSIASRTARPAGVWQPSDSAPVSGWWWVAVAAWGLPEQRPTSSPDPEETATR